MNWKQSSKLSRRFLSLLLVGGLGLAGCDFDVKNPGRILEVDLNTPAAVKTLVTGMSSDFSEEIDNIAMSVAELSDELTGSGSYNTTGLYRTGVVERELMNGHWAGLQRARWVAEDGLRRMQEDVVDDEGNPWAWQGTEYAARAYLFAGLANRMIGEIFCFSVVAASDPLGAGGGVEQPPSAAFERALNMLAEAITHATTAGEDDWVTAAHGGRAQAYVGLDDWSSAVAEAAQVPTDFVFEAVYSDNSGREQHEVYDETHQRPEMSCYETYSGSFDPPDPRAPYFRCDLDPGSCGGGATGADGLTPHWRQDKYDELGSPQPVVKGTEMRLIEAEALLRGGDVAGAMAKMNEVRTFWGLADLTVANEDEAWVHLDHERYLTLWLEARRLFDMRRWDTPDNRNRLPLIRFLYGEEFNVYEMDPGIPKRTSCLPLSFNECNSNLALTDAACGALF
jgi:hypothetical protein